MSRGFKMTFIWIIVFGFLLFYFASGSFVRNATYPAPLVAVPNEPPPPIKSVHLNTQDGNSIIGWLYNEGLPGQTPVVIYFHGNRENLQTLWQADLFSEWKQLSLICLAIDYPGYGLSKGKSSEEAIYQASHAALLWVRQHFPDSPIIVCGWSLGAAVAVQAASAHRELVNALVVLSSWASLRDVAARHYPNWMVRLLLTEKYNAMENAKKVICPTLVVHGQRDFLIPISQGQQVALEISGPCRWIPIAEAGHNDLLNHRRVWEEIGSFIREVFAESGAHHG